MTTRIKTNLASVVDRISLYAKRYQRQADEIRLLAVSKTFPADDIRLAFAAGQAAFGENYVDEAVEKMHLLSDLDIEWHYIGPVQSNKTRKIAEHFHWVHSLASIKHARRMSEQRPANMAPISVCIQLNISQESSKSGIGERELHDFARQLQDLPGLRLRGIMAIPARTDDIDVQRLAFARLASIYRKLQADYDGIDTLSMGMTGDMEAAIAEGTTMLRIGTAIFGERTLKKTGSIK